MSPLSSSGGCISRILRRILPLRSFHHFNKDDESVVDSCTTTPGLVARLMGLESLPMCSSDLCDKSRSRKRIVIPAYQELQDENFFILSFERTKSGRNSKREKETRRRRERKNKENAAVGNLEFEISGGNVIRAKKANPVELGYEAQPDSENSSPNSVLQFVGFTPDQQPASSGEVSRLANSKLRRPLSDELDNCGEKKVINNFQNDYAGKWEEMGELAAMEMMKSSWLDKEMSKNRNCLMEIGTDLELMIFDQMLNEMLINLQVF